ncbi:MAG: GNAT family N-acetyltransferase [bacterium]
MVKPEIRAVTLTDAEYAEWNQFVEGTPSGSLYSRTEYLDALCTAAGGSFRVVAVRQGDVLLGGVALYQRDSRFGSYVSPRLLLYYNGPVVRLHDTKYPSEQTARYLKVLSILEIELRVIGYGSIILKPRSTVADLRPFLAAGWTANPGYSYVVSIGDLEVTRSRIEQNLRRLIDRCGRNETAFTDDDDFDSFFRLHSSTMERVAFQVYLPHAAFRTYFETLSRQGLIKLFHARLPEGQAIATQLVLLGHSVTHTVCAGADPEYMKSGVTAFLRWKSFERLSELGHTANDLTDASLNPVTHFKSQLGGSLEPWLELRSPLSSRYRWGTSAVEFAGRSRGAAAAIARRVLRRDAGQQQGESNE